MTWSTRRAVCIVVAVAALASAALLHRAVAFQPERKVTKEVQPAQPAQPLPPKGPINPNPPRDPTEFNDSITLPKDNDLKNKLLASEAYIKKGDWVEATQILQFLVELDADVFAQVERPGPDGQKTFVWTSVKTEANRLLSTLPADGKKYYETTYGPGALSLLKEARKTSNLDLLGQVMKRYLHTEAGGEAANLLATHHLDRGNYVLAAICFERLLNRDSTEKLAPLTLFKAAFAFHHAGDTANENRAWRELSVRTRELKVGNEVRPVAELQEYVNTLAKAENIQNLAHWPMFGGNLARNGRGDGDTAYMERRWAVPTVEQHKAINDRLVQAVQRLETSNQAILPAFFPVTAVVTNKKGDRVPVVVYRSYWGLHAYDTASNKVHWKTPADGSLEKLLGTSQSFNAVTQWVDWYTNAQRPNILFENSTVGTLSTDGNLVFAIDDLAVPPPPPMQVGIDVEGPRGYNPNPNITEPLRNAILSSKLRAYALTSGKLIWEQGGKPLENEPGKPKGDKELEGSVFLGPPLPMAGKLYVLAEKHQELRLLCLDAGTGKLLQVQQLAKTRDKIQVDVARRVQAAHLAYGEGMLVCPTNAGAILGIDLLTNSLVWAFSYREKSEGAAAQPPLQPGRRPPPRQYNPNENNHWKVSAPIIQDGKVVFAAPDAQRIYCLNLRDGSRVWDQRHQEGDLYLGGVFNGKVLVVNQKSCRALSLTKGEEVWRVETGLPSGQGVASGDIYYLPLRLNKDKEPEICAIDMERGIVHAHTRSRKREVPGNLVFFEGAVISQTVTEVVAYPQLKAKLAEIDQRIKNNPNDPVVLTERGDLRLDRGDLPGAVEDLCAALKNGPNEELRLKARSKLYDTLTEYLQRDFNGAEKYLKDYEELCTIDPAGAPDEEEKARRLAETRRRRANFLFLVAKGKESQRKLVEAFEKYQEFAAFAGGTSELFTVVDEPNVKAAPDVWAQGRIAAMVANATPAERAPLEALIAEKWAKVQKSNDPEELNKFVAVFGNLFTVGKEARLRLAERLMEGTDPLVLLDAERHLTILRGRNESPELAGRAVEALARLNTKRGLLDDAAYYYELLNREYGKVLIRDGKTGSDIYNDLATDKRLLPLLGRQGRVSGKMKATEDRNGFAQPFQTYYFEHAGEPLPFFQQHQVALRFDVQQIKLIDRYNNQKETAIPGAARTMFQNILNQANQTRFRYMTLGHLVVLPVGHMVFGVDPINQKLLWERNLHAPIPALGGRPDASGVPGFTSLVPDPRDGTVLVLYPEGWQQRLGQTSPLEGSVICLQARDGLMAIDPLTNRVLWVRTDIGPRSRIFGDAELIYVVEMDEHNHPSATRALRASDGVTVTVPNFHELYARPTTRLVGATLLLQEPAPTGGALVRQYDVRTGQNLWSETFPTGSVVARTEDPNLVPVLNPADGKLRVFELRAKKEVLSVTLRPQDLVNNQGVTVLGDGTYFFVAVNGPIDPQAGAAHSNLLNYTGIRSVPVNGELYCYEAATARLKWRNPTPNQTIIVDYFRDLPVLVMTSRYNKRSFGPGVNMMNVVAVRSYEKATGKLVYDNDSDTTSQKPTGVFPPLPQNMGNFYAFVVDARTGRVELTSSQIKIIYQVMPDGSK